MFVFTFVAVFFFLVVMAHVQTQYITHINTLYDDGQSWEHPPHCRAQKAQMERTQQDQRQMCVSLCVCVSVCVCVCLPVQYGRSKPNIFIQKALFVY